MQYGILKGGHKLKAGSETSVAGLLRMSTGCTCTCLFCGCSQWFLINVLLIPVE